MSNAITAASFAPPPFDVQAVRAQFPGLNVPIHGHKLVYLDNAATAQKPQVMIDRVTEAYTHECANIHRGVHLLSARATSSFDAARRSVAAFVNAPHTHEVIFTRGATEAINLVAASFGGQVIGPGDEVLVSELEHHANIVPWQLLCAQRGAALKVVPMDDRGVLDQEAYAKLLGPKVKLVAITHMSNALGTVVPVKSMIAVAHAHNIPVLVDGSQAVTHLKVDVQDLDADFYVFSGHKLYGPTGVGILWGKTKWLEAMPPYQGGGDMIERVTFEESTFAGLPNKFEAGTPDIAGIIGMGATIQYLNGLDLDGARAHEAALLKYGTEALRTVPGLRFIGEAPGKAAVLSFELECAHPHDIGTILDTMGVAIRTGHHCAQPIMQHFGVAATARASLAFYNTFEELDVLVESLHKVCRMFGATTH